MIDSTYTPIIISLKLAFSVTIILTIISVLLSYLVYNIKNKVLSTIVDLVISIPLLLPPTVLGFYLLLLLSSSSPIGAILQKLHIPLLFNFGAMVFALSIFLLPQATKPIIRAMQNIDKNLINISHILGKNRLQILIFVIIPTIKRNIYSTITLTFASAMGSFGVLLLVGGNITGKTNVASIAIYNAVITLDYAKANKLALILVAISLIALIFINIMEKKNAKH